MWVEIIIISCVSGDRELSSSSWGCELKYSLPGTTATVPCHPLREDVSWNILSRSSVLWRIVILFVRMWVEMPWLSVILYLPRVILFVRMWVEMRMQSFKCSGTWCHPLREDVSWNVLVAIFFSSLISHPLREDVSWNALVVSYTASSRCHPLREDVSWNICFSSVLAIEFVILFVRMWVEIVTGSGVIGFSMSSSSWGCELKYWTLYRSNDRKSHPLREDVSWNIGYWWPPSIRENVILFVRMWVEIRVTQAITCSTKSSSSWGCELKYQHRLSAYQS